MDKNARKPETEEKKSVNIKHTFFKIKNQYVKWFTPVRSKLNDYFLNKFLKPLIFHIICFLFNILRV
jgi:hypothetical protein